MAKLSGFIIAKNEENRIEGAIGSIKRIVEEVIVIDSGSSDNTVKIAENLGAKVIFNEWQGYVKQKAFGESQCKNDWILNIDADEELPPALQDEIEFIFASDNQDRYKAYQIDFVILHRKDRKPRLFAPANNYIRVYNRKFCSFANVINMTTHDAVQFNKDINDKDKLLYHLNEVAYHKSGTSIEQLVAKANFYSTEQAKDLKNLNRKPSTVRIATEIIFCFFKAFFIRRYFVFGFDGFVDSIIFAFARFIRLAKAREMYENTKNLN